MTAALDRPVILLVMTGVRVLPDWVVPSLRQVYDFHALARVFADHRYGDPAADGWLTAAGLVVDNQADRAAALATMNRAVAARQRPDTAANAGAIADTLAWLVGLQSRPPFEIPRRRTDGSVVTADDLYAERSAGAHWGPERRATERRAAATQAARWAALADLADLA